MQANMLGSSFGHLADLANCDIAPPKPFSESEVDVQGGSPLALLAPPPATPKPAPAPQVEPSEEEQMEKLEVNHRT